MNYGGRAVETDGGGGDVGEDIAAVAGELEMQQLNKYCTVEVSMKVGNI